MTIEPKLYINHSVEYAQYKIHKYLSLICDAICTSAGESGRTQNRSFKPKPYWCPKLSILETRNDLWKVWSDWSLRKGTVYNSCKGVKKLFRKVCRQRMNNVLQQNFKKYNELYCCGKIFALLASCKEGKKVLSYISAHGKSPLYTGSLDAEKCFESMWHKALFYKLHGKIPSEHWILLYQ